MSYTNNYIFSFALVFLLGACKKEKPISKNDALFNQHCASCHIAPKIDELPKDIWENSILPDMMSRMNVEEIYDGLGNQETDNRPKIGIYEWARLQNYIIREAPERLPKTPIAKSSELSFFNELPITLDEQNGATITFLDYGEKDNILYYGTLSGELNTYNFNTGETVTKHKLETPITWYNSIDFSEYITEVGILDPSELKKGSVLKISNLDTLAIAEQFHRPVHTMVKDLNNDGIEEMVVSEFGNKTGKLSLMVKNDSVSYEKRVLMNLPGSIRTIAEDMNKDGKQDLITIFSQGNENVTIFYQEEDLKFRAEKVLEFSPIYGSSWFELIDYNNDGFKDIITVNGDNADKSYVNKPYHGMRIHLNDGKNNFKETYFYPLNGATRVIANDFDQDNDIDLVLLSTFPDYDNNPELSFVYLENTNTATYSFKTKVLKKPNLGRWFLMDTGDVDSDGDMDIILSSFTYVFTPVPHALSKNWETTNTDILILENTLK